MKFVIILLVFGCVTAVRNFKTICEYSKKRFEKEYQGNPKVTYTRSQERDKPILEKLKDELFGWVKPRAVRKESTKDETSKSASSIYFYDEELEHLVNLQINNELRASYAYLASAFQFEAEYMQYPGMAKFFHDASTEELDHAKMLMKYQVTRGGRITSYPIKESREAHSSVAEALDWALELEKAVTTELLCLDKFATDINDPHLADFIESKMIPEQYESMKQLASYNKTLARMSKGMSSMLAEYHFDMMTLGGSKEKV